MKARMKRVFTMILAVAVCISFMQLSVIHSEAVIISSGTCGDNLIWELEDSGTLTISGAGDMTDGGSMWADYLTQIKNVVIEAGVTSIGEWAFTNCTSLESVTFLESVTSIGEAAFYGCSNLRSVSIEGNAVTIGSQAFRGCTALADSDGFVIVNNILFDYCGDGGSVAIPSGVTSIGSSAFEACTSLTSVTIPDGVTSIGDRAFFGCSSITDVTIPDTVTSIGSCAFQYCSSIGSLTIQSSAVSIGDGAFSGCYALADSDGYVIINNILFCYCGSDTVITIPSNVSRISAYAFSDNRSVKSIEIPASVTSISNYAFYCCYGLESIELLDGITSIGDCIFYNCTSLESIIIPDGVTSIGNYAFYNCSSLESIEIPVSVTAIGDNVFSGCSVLTNVYYRGTEAQWAAVSIDSNNSSVLSSANIIYNYHEHIYSKVTVTAPTCTTGGYTTYTCPICLDSYTDNEMPATGHTPAEAVKENVVAASCTEDGSYESVVYCETCNEEISRETITIDKTGHSYVAEVIAPTYTEQGYTLYTCETCGESYIDDYTDILVLDGTDSSVSTQVTVGSLTSLDGELPNIYSSVDELIADLISRVTVTAGYTEENTAVYDVYLQYSVDGGAWATATVDNFPVSGITVTLPYPDGTDASYDFAVLHMFTETSTRLGITAGETESPTVTKTDDGLVVTLTGMSPVTISWQAPTTTTTTTTSPATGDNSNIWLWIGLLAASGVGIVGLTVYSIKRRRFL